MREEIFNLIPGMVNTVRGTAVSHNTTVASAPRISQTSLEDMLAEEANATPGHQQKHVTFMDTMWGVSHHLHPKNIKKRWSYHQDQWKETTLRMLVCMQLPMNSKKYRSPRLVN